MSLDFLNCGSMRPYFPHVKNRITCLLIETNPQIELVGAHMQLDFYDTV